MTGVVTWFLAGAIAALVACHAIDCLRNSGIR